jgi:hypothetical protein
MSARTKLALQIQELSRASSLCMLKPERIATVYTPQHDAFCKVKKQRHKSLFSSSCVASPASSFNGTKHNRTKEGIARIADSLTRFLQCMVAAIASSETSKSPAKKTHHFVHGFL